MHALVEFLLARIAEDTSTLQSLDERFGTRCVDDCNAARLVVDLVGMGLDDGPSLASCDVLLLLARPYSQHPDFCPDWRLTHGYSWRPYADVRLCYLPTGSV